MNDPSFVGLKVIVKLQSFCCFWSGLKLQLLLHATTNFIDITRQYEKKNTVEKLQSHTDVIS